MRPIQCPNREAAKKRAALRRLLNESANLSGESHHRTTAFAAIRHETHASEAEEHHSPSRWFRHCGGKVDVRETRVWTIRGYNFVLKKLGCETVQVRECQ